jgi:hypothetical protein
MTFVASSWSGAGGLANGNDAAWASTIYRTSFLRY